MNTIKLTRDNLHALSSSPGQAGFTRKQIEALGLSWPMKQGWLSGLIGKEISQEQYDRVKSLANPKWEGFCSQTRSTKRLLVGDGEQPAIRGATAYAQTGDRGYDCRQQEGFDLQKRIT